MKKRNKTKRRFLFLIYLNSFLFLVLFMSLFYVQIIKNKYYKEEYQILSENIIDGPTAPRGRIYDRTGKIIVDNEPIRIIYYKKRASITIKEEIDLAYKLANLLEIDYSKISDDNKRTFWIKKFSEKASLKITDKEKIDLKYHKITGKDIENYKKERITEEELNTFSELDLEAAYIYYLMNKGYSYSEKVIKNKDVSDSEYAVIASQKEKLDGVGVKIDWERSYPYGDTFKSILGSVSSSEKGIPSDLKDYYLEKGYNLDDRVGTSYLEYKYDDYLKGVKNKYRVKKDNSLELIKTGKKGSDIYLTIDIELQQAIEKIVEEEMLKAKSEANTTYYNRSFVIVTDPKTGEILAMVGKQITYLNGEYIFYDYSPGTFASSVVVGSVIKGASHIVGYNTGALSIGETRYDNCVKLKNAPLKCSWQPLGRLDDIKALKMSSNTYQFYTAFKVANVKYFYDMPFAPSSDAFKIYRDTFAEFGLGVKTGIDLPNETEGLKGTNESGGLLLDFTIGQYDNYTPLQLSQYVSTIANNGSRMKFYLLKSVVDDGKIIYETKPKELNKVKTEQAYLDRVKEGFKAVLSYGGTGSGYMDLKYNPAGKTGTSQSFVDTNSDNVVDTETVSNTFVGFAPYDNPKVTFTVVSPDTYDYGTNYQSYVNKRIAKRISDKYFEIYP